MFLGNDLGGRGGRGGPRGGRGGSRGSLDQRFLE